MNVRYAELVVTVVDAKKLPGPPGASNILVAPLDSDGAPRTVGPFAMVAHIKMPTLAPGALPVDADVRPHPHIGLTAISYVIEGAITHRDSLGNRRELGAGGVGGTVSGLGVVHSERFERIRLHGGRFEMFQILLALPDGCEDIEPSFFFRAREELATSKGEGASACWLLEAPPGALASANVVSTTAVSAKVPSGKDSMPGTSPILLADVALELGALWSVPEVPERALYVLEGEVEIGASRLRAGQVAVLGAGEVSVRALETARLLAFGGAGVGPRYLWWNYLHSSLERIEAAKAEWRQGRAKLPVGDTESFTPCPPDDGRPLVRLNQP